MKTQGRSRAKRRSTGRPKRDEAVRSRAREERSSPTVIGLTYSQVACGPLEGCVGNDFFGLRPMTVSEWDFVSTMILMVATVFAEEVAYRAYVINEMLRITDAKTLIFLTSSLLIGLKDFLYSYYLTGSLSFYLIPLIGEEVAGGLFIGLCYLYTDRNLLACVALRSCYTYVDKV